MEAFVPPKPNEFEIAAAAGDSAHAVGHNVEIEAGIRDPEVDVGREKAVPQRENR